MDPGKLLESGKYSDLTIICHGREFRVHKAILCPQSEIISKLCDIDMQEKHTGKIQHEEFDDDTMERMIEFAYRKQYKATVRPKALGPEGMKALVRDTASSTVEDDLFVGGIALVQNDADSVNASIQEEEIQLSATDVWVIHARVYGLADYYDMSELRDYAMNCFMQVSKDEQEDIALDGFIHVAREVSKRTTSDSGFSSNSPLRAGFLSLFSTHAPKLAADGDFLAALYEPGLKDITVEMFKILGQKMVELETENKETAASFQAEKEVLQQLFSGATQSVEARVRGAQHREEVAVERRERTEESTQRLLRSLRNLPAGCLNNNCNNEFGELKFEMKGNGDWQVRCGAKKCKCKLN